MFWELLLCLAIAIMIDYGVRRYSTRNMPNIPIVSRIPIVGSLLTMASFQPDNLHLKFQEFVTRFGKSFHARLFGYLIVVTADARYVEEILSSQKHLRKHAIYHLLSTWLGDGLLLSHGSVWQRMRRIITPAFHFKILEQFVEVFDRQSSILVERLAEKADGENAVDIYPYMGLAMLDVIAETAMGVTINAQINSKSEFVQSVKEVTLILATRFVRPHLIFAPIYRLLKPNLYKKQQEGIRIMHEFTEKIIQRRRQALQDQSNANVEQISNPDDEALGIKTKRLALLDILLQSSIEGQPLSDEQIRSEVNTFMFEGHDTTSSAVSFCLYLLSRHADAQAKLYNEILAHFGKDLNKPIRYQDLQELEYLNCVTKESLRLYPPIPAIGRYLLEECPLVDTTLPAHTNVIILIWMLLRDPDMFPNPTLFQPERHRTEQTGAHAFYNIPFSAGPRNCIGQRFAVYEMKTVIIKVLRHYELLPLGEEISPSIKIVLRSKTGVNMGLRKRL